MRNFIRNTMLRLRKDERGVTLVEYGIGIMLAVSLGAGALTLLGNDVGAALGTAAGQMPTTAPAAVTSYPTATGTGG